MADSIVSEFITESVKYISSLSAITKKSLKSIESLDKLCLKLSNRIDILSTDLKTKDHEKHEEIKTLRLLIEAIFQKRIALTSSHHDLINQHIKFLEQMEHSLDDVIDSCDPLSNQSIKTRKSNPSSGGSSGSNSNKSTTTSSRNLTHHHNSSSNAAFLSPVEISGTNITTTHHNSNNTNNNSDASSSATPLQQKRKLSHSFHGNQYTSFKAATAAANEPVYCTCRQIAYGDMIGCDNESCKFEWFHYACVGLDKSKKSILSRDNETWICQQCTDKEKSAASNNLMASSPTSKKKRTH